MCSGVVVSFPGGYTENSSNYSGAFFMSPAAAGKEKRRELRTYTGRFIEGSVLNCRDREW